MNENALMYFYETATLGSMRLASDKIGVAVSSISRQVAQLERRYGATLIERGRRSIKLTAAGQIAYDYYRSTLVGREAFHNRLQELRQFKTGLVTLAVGEGFLGAQFTAVIEAFHQANPGVNVTLHSGSSADLLRMVTDDEAHIGLVFHGVDVPKVRVRASALQPLMVLCAPDHPLALKTLVRLADLADHRLCLPPKGFRIRQTLSVAEVREHLWLQPRLVTDSLQVMREMAKMGGMATILPPISALAELENGSLVARPLAADDLDHTTISLIHRVGRQLEGAPARLLAMLETKLRTWAAVSG